QRAVFVLFAARRRPPPPSPHSPSTTLFRSAPQGPPFEARLLRKLTPQGPPFEGRLLRKLTPQGPPVEGRHLDLGGGRGYAAGPRGRKSTRRNSRHVSLSYAVHGVVTSTTSE